MDFLQKNNENMHLQYCNIKLDVGIGTAMNVFLMKWQIEEKFKNIIIHLGNLNFLKENWEILGIMMKNSGCCLSL